MVRRTCHLLSNSIPVTLSREVRPTSGHYYDLLPPRISIDAEPPGSVSVQFVAALMSSSQRVRGLPLCLVPPPVPNIIDFFKPFIFA